MKTATSILVVLLGGFALCNSPVTPPARAQSKAAGMTTDDVLQLVQAGLSEEVIIAKLRKNGKAFDLSTAQLVQLKKAGVKDSILKVMMDPKSPADPDPAPKPTDPPPDTGRVTMVPDRPTDPVAGRVPESPGMYYLAGSELIKVDLKTLASEKVAGRTGHLLTLGIKSVKVNAYLIGSSARLKAKDQAPVFYARVNEGQAIDELVLVSLYPKADRRELEVSALGGAVGAKHGIRMEVMKPFETQELGPRLYKGAAGILPRGEYLFYIVGSADNVKGIQGKGYDFSVE